MTKADSTYDKIKNDNSDLGIKLNYPTTLELIEQLEHLINQKLPNDFKDFYKLTNGFETNDFLFRLVPIEEIILNHCSFETNRFSIAEYMINSDTWDMVIDKNGTYKIVNSNHATEQEVTLTTSIFEFIEMYIDGGGIFGNKGLYKLIDNKRDKNITYQRAFEILGLHGLASLIIFIQFTSDDKFGFVTSKKGFNT